ncbi:MAG: hypothetical protein JWR00_4655, partial [Rubritepida sp.]|nr:hypothetical protein [Rubritepida sp.]
SSILAALTLGALFWPVVAWIWSRVSPQRRARAAAG